MGEPGNRDTRVTTDTNRQDAYDRIRSQSRRSFRAVQSLGGEYCQLSGKRYSGSCELPERRGRTGGALALLEGAANRGREVTRVRRLSRNAAQEFLNRPTSIGAAKRIDAAKFALPQPQAAMRISCALFLLLLATACLSGCGHKATQARFPPAPSLPSPQHQPATAPATGETTGQLEKIEVPAGAKPIFEETGMASWYGAPYHNRRGSNGEVYDMNAMTAARLAAARFDRAHHQCKNRAFGGGADYSSWALCRRPHPWIYHSPPRRRWMSTCRAWRKLVWKCYS